ncbi:alpha-glucosidase [Butyrivibrio proteoclasticus]|uniref:alpha-glucosidase n=1 Tax=Butyrivibrio proteoclasticus TaxID=43305 RepID=UPI00047AE469|nr:alpha-glucosidase [Butyrivibrio proteoclasticus]
MKDSNSNVKNRDWYKRMSFYQIWVRSFADGNGDGIGDLYGVYDKLEYVKSLGVDGIWFSPIYPSPNADFGYDISDYKDIHPDFGTLEQFKKVLFKAHEMGLKVIMDLVVNHTSDEHPWFLESKKGKDNPYSDYYIWRDKPNNWDSLFEGKAWEYVPERGQYYLHIFAKKQPDLNMDNPKVREEVKSIMRFWLDMGVDGFREDVINFISKVEGLPNGVPFLPAVNGMPYYKDGPHIHEYLAEFRKVCDEYDCFQLGEGPMTTVKSAMNYLTGPTKSLDMMFSFDHMMADCLYTEYVHRPFSLIKLKKAFSKWQYALNGKGWNALYLENHDHPRIISRYGSHHFWRESGTMLAASYIFQQGTPFVYQGQEIGMTNIKLMSIDQYVDVSSKTNYHTYHLKEDPERRLHRIHLSSRDSARTPMQWDSSENAGFSKVRPWFYVNPNYKRINVAAEEGEPDSILNFYRKCLALRKSSDTLIYGDYTEHFAKDKNIYMYERSRGGESYLVICSFSRLPVKAYKPKKFAGKHGELVLCNYARKYAGDGTGRNVELTADFNGVDNGRDKLKNENFKEYIDKEIEEIEVKHGFLRPFECRIYRYEN